MSKLELFDTKLVDGSISINFDPKHLVKRLRGIIISDARTIQLVKVPFNRLHLEQKFRTHSKIDSLLKVKDKQNVPLAVELVEFLGEVDSYAVSTNPLEYNINQEIRLLAIISKLLLSLFAQPCICLVVQLTNMSNLSHLLLIIYRKKQTQFLTNDLYNDIQSTIQDAYFSTAKIIDFISDARVYLYQLGTDQLEASFSNVRTQTHSRNCDFLELIDRLGIARQIDLVYENNESWKSQSRLETRANTKD